MLNPDFENSKLECAEVIGILGMHLDHWTTPTLGTSDIFNTCANGRTGIPFNFNGHQDVEFGSKYAGVFLYADKNYREYLQGKLSAPLEKGKKYRLSFYISLAENSDHALKNIGVLFSEKGFYIKTARDLSERQLNTYKVKNYTLHQMQSSDYFEDKDNWVQVTEEFFATGKENFITIGNFENNHLTKLKLLSNRKGINKAYYYIDKVAVELVIPIQKREDVVDSLLLSAMEPEMIADPQEMDFNKSYIFENIMFDFNSTLLTTPAKDQIKSIHDFLLENLNVQLLVSGHTDNIGSAEYNKALSENRAKAVAAYLKELGLPEERIRLAAFGKSEPLTGNKTDRGRSINRRVEFRITGTKTEKKVE